MVPTPSLFAHLVEHARHVLHLDAQRVGLEARGNLERQATSGTLSPFLAVIARSPHCREQGCGTGRTAPGSSTSATVMRGRWTYATSQAAPTFAPNRPSAPKCPHCPQLPSLPHLVGVGGFKQVLHVPHSCGVTGRPGIGQLSPPVSSGLTPALHCMYSPASRLLPTRTEAKHNLQPCPNTTLERENP